MALSEMQKWTEAERLAFRWQKNSFIKIQGKNLQPCFFVSFASRQKEK
jgi:hypothetical protein